MDVALASCLRLSEPDPDAAPLAHALGAAGVCARTLAWDDPAVDWSEARLTVLRSTWNYPLDRERFLAWAEHVAAVSELRNPLPLVKWNSHKRYLIDLERTGLPVTPTVLLLRDSRRSLASVLRETGWNDVVVKPAVSAASHRTARFVPERLADGERHLASLVAERDVLVQRYLPAVETYGERALVWIDGALTHAVRKTPRFEGEAESVSEAVAIAPEEASLAERAIAVVGETLLYARVDVAPGPDESPVLMELELIEPSLFFQQNPAALERFVRGVKRLLGA